MPWAGWEHQRQGACPLVTPSSQRGCSQPACSDCCRGRGCRRSGDFGNRIRLHRAGPFGPLTPSGLLFQRRVPDSGAWTPPRTTPNAWSLPPGRERWVRAPATAQPMRCPRPPSWAGRIQLEGRWHGAEACDGHRGGREQAWRIQAGGSPTIRLWPDVALASFAAAAASERPTGSPNGKAPTVGTPPV
jgi:hypothetical protein